MSRDVGFEMNKEQSIVKKTESALDDLRDLWRRRKTICVIVLIVILLPGGFILYQQFVAVPKLKGNVRTLQTAKRKAEQERDKAELKLAPYISLVNQHFQDIPEEERLNTLSEKLDGMLATVQHADRNILLKLDTIGSAVDAINQRPLPSGDRSLSSPAVATMTSSLKAFSDWQVEIVCLWGDGEAHSLSEQIRGVFAGAGWEVNGVNQVIHSKPIRRLVVVFGQQPPGELQRALLPLFDSLGYARSATLDPSQDENKIKIVVGTK